MTKEIGLTISEIDEQKNNLLKLAKKLHDKKGKLFSNIEIESPMSLEERELNSQVALIWSQINSLVALKRNIKN